jgi:hypothetical protein
VSWGELVFVDNDLATTGWPDEHIRVALTTAVLPSNNHSAYVNRGVSDLTKSNYKTSFDDLCLFKVEIATDGY